MLQPDAYYSIAENIFYNVLGLTDDYYKTFKNGADVRAFNKKYLDEEDYLRGLVIDELANYDTSENHPSEIEDITENAISDLFFRLDDITEKYYQAQHYFTLNVYGEIVSAINNIVGVDSVETDYDPGDPENGDYDETRTITVTLTNGAEIYFNVDISEE